MTVSSVLGICQPYTYPLGLPGDSVLKNSPAMQEPQETWVRSLGWEDPLEEGMAAHSSVPAWRIPWAGEPGGLPSMGLHRVGDDCSDLARMYLIPYRTFPESFLSLLFILSDFCWSVVALQCC